ncbi:hypothetical protein KZO25_09530 [Halomonas sp. ANAO-440]|uniref:hypothetical protein n=1 Tax=Halomonas sp. ANAO-440 TaxID=2861360 RepID=UPI001CAA5A25|nr:hypothetical protein [Halomonas sp. ANAO-440]MBZ0330559.1 hypothetical protein [Halomonas sp. ANAO-440]
MNIGIIIVAVLKGVAVTVLTEKVIINLIVALASWAVTRYGNDLTQELFEPIKEALDKRHGQSRFNLYDELRH